MRRVLSTLFLILALLAPATTMAQQHPRTPMYDVVFEVARGEDLTTHAEAVMTQLGVPVDEFEERLRFTYVHTINGYALSLTPWEADKAQRLLQRGADFGLQSVTVAEEFTVTPIEVMTATGATEDPLAHAEVVPVGIERIGKPTRQANHVNVAVIDTGIDATHTDLNVVGGVDCIDPDMGWGFDGNGHGTHVAGTIAAKQNGSGVVGVAPGANLYSVRVLDSNGSGTTATVLCGIDWVAGADIQVANMSLGGRGVETECGGEDPMHNAFCIASETTVFVVAAGNSTSDAKTFSPANYIDAVTVSAYTDYDGMPGGFALTPAAGCVAMSVDDELAAFSNYGPHVDITAPGVCILSTYPNQQYAYASGTSMAAPHVAGCVARYLHDNPDQTDVAVDQILTWSASRSGNTLAGDHDGVAEPLLNCASIPRA